MFMLKPQPFCPFHFAIFFTSLILLVLVAHKQLQKHSNWPKQQHFFFFPYYYFTRLTVQNMADAFSTPSTQHPLQNYILKTFGLFLIHRNSTTMFQNMADAFFIGHFLDDHPKYGRT